MSGNLDLVLETIEDPDYIVQGWTDELIALKHYEETTISEKYMEENVVYHYRDKELVGVTVIGAKKYSRAQK